MTWTKPGKFTDEEYEKYEKALDGAGKNMRLRTPGRTPDTTTFVSAIGSIINNGFPVDKKGAYVRPMMWIKTV